ncbi:MAG TPA: DedA family protein [Candidatus Paceibacterota bacterium]|nr:DedA family protein [Candidatus Pacearchaeota archaeon]HPC30480.1 DedA family protein [Candidatus Pacearchaeota archaeon]HQK58373.1 DedA family protein [Candidatus Pacearchaeota archaeon]HRR94702.1 DedA family protein [Candidatus Paceibacterota bacterium]HRU20802.1 DedA family protein [Candidatus Paceibacterota bacterium]
MFEVIFDSDTIISLIKATGYIGVWAAIFAETGLFFGFFLPGDSLLFAAGLLASQGFLNIFILSIGVFIAAVLGDNTGYAFGKKTGPLIFKREDSLLFHKKNLIRAEEFYKKYGTFTIIIARFIPIIRTFAPIVAGVGKMEYKKFFIFNIIGGLIWALSLPLIGYYLLAVFPQLENYINLIIILIIFVSLIPAALQFLKEIKNPRAKA